jgi:hypothetical protein
MKPLLLIAVLINLAVLPQMGLAQMPRTIAFQGVLTDSLGSAKPDGTYRILFTLYDVSSGGTALWSETKLLPVKNGYFSTLLGDTNPIGSAIRFDRQMWLGISLGPDPELSPRIELASVGSSFFADSARVSGTISDSSVSGGKILSGQVVKSLNGLHDAVVLRGQGGATITSSNDTITINAGSGGGGTGIQGIQNSDNALDITNPTGPTATINLKAGGVTTAALANGAITPQKVSASGATSGQSITYNGSSVVWGTPQSTLALPYTGSGALSGAAFHLTNTGSGQGLWVNAASDAIVGQSSNAAKSGVWGDNTAGGYGVSGSSLGTSTAGVWGSNSGSGYGVRATSAQGLGVYAQTSGTASSAVYGYNTATGGLAPGVYGNSVSPSGVGVYGTNNGDGSSIYGYMTGAGHAGRFEINNVGSTSAALMVSTNGSGPAAELTGDLAVTGKLTVIGSQGAGRINFPYNTINSYVTSDEAGIAHAYNPGTTVYFGGTSTAVISRTFTAPADGYAVVLAGGSLYAFEYNGYLYTVDFGLSATSGDISTFPSYFQFDTGTPDGNYLVPIQLCGVFPISAGLNTFYFNAKWASGHGTNGAAIYDPRISVLYFPTAYGAVAPPSAPAKTGGVTSMPKASGTFTPESERAAPASPALEAKPNASSREKEIESLKVQLREIERRIGALSQ